jgi:hypothetical protein
VPGTIQAWGHNNKQDRLKSLTSPRIWRRECHTYILLRETTLRELRRLERRPTVLKAMMQERAAIFQARNRKGLNPG